MSTSRRDLLRLRWAEDRGRRPGEAVPQQASPGLPRPGCSAEHGPEEAPPPWARGSNARGGEVDRG